MTVLAEAAVEITAETTDFGASLQEQVEAAGAGADRAARTVGTRLGESVSAGATRSLRGLRTAMSRALDATPYVRSFVRGFQRIDGAARGFEGTMSRVGRSSRSALDPLTNGLGRFRDGFNSASAAASAFSGRLGSLGGAARSMATTTSNGFRRIAGAASTAWERVSSGETAFGRLARSFPRLARFMAIAQAAIVAALASLPAAASLAATATAVAFGAGIAGIGIAAAAQSERVQETFVGLRDHVLDTLKEIAAPFEDTLIAVADQAQRAFDGLTPNLERAFADAAPAVEEFTGLLLGSLDAFGPTIDAATRVFVDTLSSLGPQLAPFLEDLAATLTGLFNSADPDFFAGFVVGVLEFADSLIRLVTWLANAHTWLSNNVGPVLEELGPAVDSFAEGFDAVRQVFVQAMGVLPSVTDGLAALERFLSDNADALRIVGSVLGGMVATLAIYRGAVMAATLASRLLSLGIRGVGAAVRSIPLIGWVLAAVGALIALYQTSEDFREIVDTAFTRVREVVQEAWDYIEPVWNTMADKLSELWETVSGWDGWQVAWEGITGAVSGAWDVISEIWDRLSRGWQALTSGEDTSGWSQAWDTLTLAAETTWEVLERVFGQISEAWELLTGLISGDADLGDVGEYLAGSFERLGEIGSLIGGFLVDQLRKLPGLALEALGWLGERVAGWFSGLPERVSEAVGGPDGFLAWLQDLPERAVEHLKELAPVVLERIRGIPEFIEENIDPGAIVAWLREVPGRIIEFMRDYGPQILKGIGIAVAVVVAGIPALLAGLLATVLVVLGMIAWELIKWAGQAFGDIAFVAGQKIGEGINRVVAWFASLPERAMAALVGFATRLATWGANAIASLRARLTARVRQLLVWWDAKWNEITASARGIWDRFVGWASGAAGRLRDNIMGPVRTLAENVVIAFNAAREGVNRAWSALRRVVAQPIEWVVNTAYNEWLRGVWGKVVDKFGGPSLPSYTVEFAKGGVFPGSGGGAAGVFSGYTPGRDVHSVPMAAFSGGESVLRPEITRAWGARTTLMLNKLARTGGVGAVRRALAMLFSGQNPFTGRSAAAPPSGGGGFAQRFARGGILGSVGGSVSRAAEWLGAASEDFGEGMLDFLSDPGGTLRKILEQVMDYTRMPGWGSSWTSVLRGVPEGIIDTLVDQAQDLFTITGAGDWSKMGGGIGGRLGAALGFAKAQAGKPYVWGGVGPHGYDCSGFLSAIMNVILGKNPYRRRFTTHSFVGNSANGFRRNLPSPFTLGNTHANVGHQAGTLLRTNVESRGSAGVVVGSRARGSNHSLFTSRWGMVGPGRRSGRMGGEGLLYDSGGVLRPGLTLVNNATRKPETVRSYAQEGRVARLVRLVEAQHRPVSGAGVVPAGRERDLARVLGGDGALGGTVVNAPITVNTAVSDPAQVAVKVVDRLVQRSGI